ncbi:RHS repeat-associated core domain-containing protein [Pseudomonas alabamensis]|uniref:RHS repeat-associated core domain-containing protein n=1 Tax=Pseudomonas alabamensis TaxID=3064349 RepID=UPI003F6516C6
MSEDFGGFDCISVDEYSGTGKFILPIAEVLNEEQEPLFTLELDADLIDPQFNLFSYGTWSLYWGGLAASTSKLSLNDLPFTNGQRVTCNVGMEGFTRGDNYLVDAELFIQARVENVKKEGSSATVTSQRHITVMLKNGVAHVYELIQPGKDAHGHALLSQVVAPSGKAVDFTWVNKKTTPRLASISRAGQTLLKADWANLTLQKLEVFPQSEEVKTFSIAYSDTAIEITLTGQSSPADQLTYALNLKDKHVESLHVVSTYKNPTPCIHTNSALFTYSDNKVSSYHIQPHGYTDKSSLTAVYAYNDESSARSTTITCFCGQPPDTLAPTAQPIGVYTYNYEEGRLTCFKADAGGTVEEIRHEMALLEAESRVRLTATRVIDAQEVGSFSWEFDACGNLVKHEEDGVITEWTYYNDYDVYQVEEQSERVSTVSGKNWLSHGAAAAFDYANPIGLGLMFFGNSGLTWYKVLHSTVNLSHAGTTYAKEAFQLPLDLVYPGATTGFSSHPESELVSARQDGAWHAQSLTFYGYQKFIPIKQPHVRRAHVLKPSRRLTIVEPDLERVDISALQLKIARDWAKPFSDSLKAQVAASQDEDDKAQFIKMQASLETCLKRQSKQNAMGFKLKKPWKAMSMRVDELTYESDTQHLGFACLKESSTYALDQDGKPITSKKVVTTLSYNRQKAHAHRLTVTATIKSPDGVTTTCSTTRSELTNRLYEQVDREGQVIQLQYKPNGMFDRQSLSAPGQPNVDITYTLTALSNGHFKHTVQNSEFNHTNSLHVDPQGRVRDHWLTRDGTTWLLLASSEYSNDNLESHVYVYDYDAQNLRISEHETSTTIDAERNDCTVVRTLKDGEGNVVDSKTITVTQGDNESKATHGDFTLKQTWDTSARIQTLTSSLPSCVKGEFNIQSIYNPEGYRVEASVGITEGTKKTELKKIEFKYDKNGWLKKSDYKAGGHSVSNLFEYDTFGRLVSQNSNGIVINNTYPADTQTPIATTATITDSHSGTLLNLGSQTVDGLGRLKSRTVNGVTESFTTDAVTKLQDTPIVPTGYACNWSSDTQTLTVDCPIGVKLNETPAESLKTVATYSQAGRLLHTTDIIGHVTHYGYDAFERVVTLRSESFETTFLYRDDGLLQQEVINDISSKRSMTVVYEYDVAGNEISRTFNCLGMPSHQLKRTLLADGKLSKSQLFVDRKTHSSDAYQYDNHGRLSQWSAKGKFFELREGYFTNQTFEYDVLGNVTAAISSQDTTQANTQRWTYTFKKEFSADKPGLPTRYDKVALASDAQGRLIFKNSRYYSNGQPDVSEGLRKPDNAVITYGYDDVGRLCGLHLKTVEEIGYRFHYRAGLVYARSEMFAQSYGGNTTLRRDLVMLNESPGCYLQERWDNGKQVARTFELRDATGTIFATVHADNSTEYHAYSPYGYKRVSRIESHWLGYKGEPVLPDGNYYLGNYRLYNPELMSFQSPDSFSPFGDGGPAAYAYCAGDPINYHDPSGHQRVAEYSRKASGTLLETKEFRYVMAAAGLLSAPFTGGTSLGLAIAVTGLAVVASGFEIASLIIEDSDPELAHTLGYVGLGIGISSAVAGFAIAARTAGATAGRSMISSSMKSSSTSRQAMRAGRPPASVNTVAKKGLHRFGFKADTVPTIPVSQSPAGTGRLPQWFSETPTFGPPRMLWGTDMEIVCRNVQEPLIRISRRNSASSIHIYSGAHGRVWGDNWIRYQNPQGRVAYRRNPLYNETRFFNQDVNAYERFSLLHPKKPLVTQHQVNLLNQARGTADNVKTVRRALRKRKIFIHDLGGFNNQGITLDALNNLENQPGHHIGAFCFSRNDERWLFEYSLAPVTSWI